VSPRRIRKSQTLSIAVAGNEPPSEFRIFKAGQNETSKGVFIFDDKAAEHVLATYADQGNELMVDYDHGSLGLAVDPAHAGKAAGWFNLELRDGELWAANVRWTEPAAKALAHAEWRYLSPAFELDENGRVLSLINVALTNMPATKRMQPLMAASALALSGGSMDPEMIKKALAAIKEGDSDAALALLEGMIAEAAGGEAPAEEEAPAEVMAEEPPPEEEEEEEEEIAASEDAPAVAAATARLLRLTGKDTFGTALDEIETWRQSHINLAKRDAQLTKDRAAIEASDRRRLYGDLVTKASFKPARVWADSKAKKALPHLERMSLVELSQFVADEIAALPEGARKTPRPPTSAQHELSAEELALCARKKIDPAKYAANRAAIKARSTNASRSEA
jgi:hypothetical protein